MSDPDRRRQLARLRTIATRALGAYELAAPVCRLVAHGWNTTYRVDTADGSRLLLRVHRAEVTGVDQIAAELAWLDALARDTALPVPRVIHRRDGAPAGAEGGRVCVLLSWTPGRFLEDGLRPVHLRRVGGLLAGLHEHRRRWSLPADVSARPVYGVDEESWRHPDQLGAESVRRMAAVAQDAYGEDAGAVVTATMQRIRAAADGLGTGPAEYGLLHGDLHYENFLFTAGGRVAAIDFDDCGLGHDAYDLAVTVSELRHRDDIDAVRAALLAGYREVRPLSGAAEASIDAFAELKRVQLMFWIIDRRHGDAAEWWRRSTANDLAALRAFLA